MRSFAGRKWVGVALLLGFAALNFAAYRQARAFTHFAPPGHRVAGVEVPRPENHRTPRVLGLPYERHVFTGGRGVPLEAWLVPRVDARGTVVLFHGHAASKDSQLREAKAFHDMGFNLWRQPTVGGGLGGPT